MLDQGEEQEVVALCRSLVRTRGYSGQEKAAANVLNEYFQQKGFDEVVTDACGNVMGVIQGTRPGPCIVFDGHLDTVTVHEAEWTEDPFGGTIRDGRLYGRGASDMKGAVAAMACAAALFASQTGRDFPGKIVVAGTVQEELFEGVASKFVCDRYSPDYVVIGEASNLNLKVGQRGRAELVVETFGTTAHSAHPETGNNAVLSMHKVIETIEALPTAEHPVLGGGILVLTDIKSDPYPGSSCVPAYCKVTYDRRTLVGETKESVLAPIQTCLSTLEKADGSVHAKVSYACGSGICYTGQEISAEKFFPAWLFDRQSPFVQSCLKELHKAGFDPEVTVYDFCTNGSYYAGEAGIPTIGLGPSREDLAHTVDEYIEISQLSGAVPCYAALMKALLNDSSPIKACKKVSV